MIRSKWEALWFAIQTKPRQEAVAEQILHQGGVETFFPRISINKALFTSYIFAKFPLATHFRQVKYAQGVKGIVGFGEEPAPVEEALLDAIRLRIKDGYVVLEPPSFKRGERVRVMEGPWEGIEGIFDSRLKDSERVVILLSALTAQGRLVLPGRLLGRQPERVQNIR